jgi:V/A-type H+-transporting ATPase subunit F
MIAVIGDSETATGFRLAGVKEVHESAAGSEDVTRLLDKLTRDEVAVIIISERLAAETRNREKIREINAKKSGVTPIIIELPDKKGPMEEKVDEISWLIKRAVGVAVK